MKQIKNIRLPSGKRITGTLVWYYFVCKREVWLMGHEITPDEEDESLKLGRTVHKIYYKDMREEVELDGIKIDRVRGGIIYEIKTSDKYIEPARFQLLYYIYRLREEGVHVEGEILVPTKGKRISVKFTENYMKILEKALNNITVIINQDKPPEAEKAQFCRKCAYRDFCWS